MTCGAGPVNGMDDPQVSTGVAYDSAAQASCFRVSPKKDRQFNAVLQPAVSRRTGRSVMGWSVWGREGALGRPQPVWALGRRKGEHPGAGTRAHRCRSSPLGWREGLEWNGAYRLSH
jgi:hypothetical protein